MQPTKIEIPDQLKSDVPQTTWGKILSATPVVMAVVATMLAGLASSEMTRAQYDRSLAAQQQSKAGDQWSFFQAKRLRGSLQQNTLDLLHAQGAPALFNSGAFLTALSRSSSTPVSGEGAGSVGSIPDMLSSAQAREAFGHLEKGSFPAVPPGKGMDQEIGKALELLHSPTGEPELQRMLSKMKEAKLAQAVIDLREQANAFEALTEPMNDVIDTAAAIVERAKPSEADASILKAFTISRLKFAAMRYEQEARLNQGIAYLYELQVRRSNLSAERHHDRSQRFFYGMLAAQAGVIIATFAMAARKRNFLWSIAAAAGLLAVAFAIYVYLYV